MENEWAKSPPSSDDEQQKLITRIFTSEVLKLELIGARLTEPDGEKLIQETLLAIHDQEVKNAVEKFLRACAAAFTLEIHNLTAHDTQMRELYFRVAGIPNPDDGKRRESKDPINVGDLHDTSEFDMGDIDIEDIDVEDIDNIILDDDKKKKAKQDMQELIDEKYRLDDVDMVDGVYIL